MAPGSQRHGVMVLSTGNASLPRRGQAAARLDITYHTGAPGLRTSLSLPQTRRAGLTLLELEGRPLHHGDATGRTWRRSSSLKAPLLERITSPSTVAHHLGKRRVAWR